MNGNDEAHRRVTQQETDLSALSSLGNGDPNALETLYDTYATVTLAVIFRIVRDRAVAEDLLQDVFLRIWQRAETYRPDRGTVRAWILGIAHNTGLNEIRRQRRRPVSADPPGAPGQKTAHPEHPLDLIQDPDPDPAEMAWIRERRELIASAMDQVSDVQRTVIELYAAGYSQSEVAARLGEPLGTVKTRMRRGLLQLRKLLPDLSPLPVAPYDQDHPFQHQSPDQASPGHRS